MVWLFKLVCTEIWHCIVGLVGYGHKWFPAIVGRPSPFTTIFERGRSPVDRNARPDPNSPAQWNNCFYLSSCGTYLHGATDPFPHIRSPFGALLGAIHRFCRRVPIADGISLRKLRRFTQRYSRRHFAKVDKSVLHFYDWLLNTSYTEAQRAQLVDMFERLHPGAFWLRFTEYGPRVYSGLSFEDLVYLLLDNPLNLSRLNRSLRRDKFLRRDMRVHSFIKAEQYPAFKLPRAINGRVDYAKIIFGPLIKTVEKVVYLHPSFIKSIPLAERPAYITQLVAGPGYYCATDHTSFESSFTMGLCLAVEYEVYCHVLNPFYAEYICKGFYSLNVCVFKFFRLTVAAKRMSGDMNTSLGNGVTNLITILFLYHQKYKVIITAIVIEGDDSLFRLPFNASLTTEEFASLGLITKIELHNRLSTAAFCGSVFDEVDLKNLVDPGRILRRFGFVDNKYHNAKHSTKMGLLRAYAFSIYYQYHGCPIVESLAKYLLRVTRGYYAKMTSINVHRFSDLDVVPASEEKMFERFPPCQIGMGSREIIHSLFKLSYDDQIWCEDYLDSLNVLQPLVMPVIIANSPRDCIDYFRECSVTNPDVDVRPMEAPPASSFYKLIQQLRDRFDHLQRRHIETSIHDVEMGAIGPYCRCGLQCLYYDDILHGLRKPLGLLASPA